ncbi:MAG: hypothetical protein V3S30_07295 [Thermoanaerobaculia bacterium]
MIQNGYFNIYIDDGDSTGSATWFPMQTLARMQPDRLLVLQRGTNTGGGAEQLVIVFVGGFLGSETLSRKCQQTGQCQ